MLRKILKKNQPNFMHYVKKSEAQAINTVYYKKKHVLLLSMEIFKFNK